MGAHRASPGIRVGVHDGRAGHAVMAHVGPWVRHSTPGSDGTRYVAVCVSAFIPHTVHREPP